MRDLASCFTEHAVKVSDSSCSGSSGGSSTVPDYISDSADSIQSSSINSLYRCSLSNTGKELLIRVVWSKTRSLSLAIDGGPPIHLCGPRSACMKGSRSSVSGDSVIGLYWDLSSAKYALGPEPVRDFYIAVVADAEVGLLLGDGGRPSMSGIPVADFSMVSRSEQVAVSGNRLQLQYATATARFHGSGRAHEMVIRCKRGDGLSVCIDGRRVVHVARLQWNFRGNQMVFVDGLPVDMMWDVHDWCFGGRDRAAAFMFRTRSKLESRLWLEEEVVVHGKIPVPAFSLLIQALKS